MTGNDPMERQLELKLTDRMERAANFDTYIAPLGFQPREIAVLRLLHLDGAPRVERGQHIAELRISRAAAAKRCEVNKITFHKAVTTLRELGLVAVDDTAEPWRYVVNLSKLAKWEAPTILDPLTASGDFGHFWSPLVTPGHGARAVNTRVTKPRVNPCTVFVNTSGVTGHDQPTGGEGPRELPARPWATLADADLAAAVDGLDGRLLRHLYDELLKLSSLGKTDVALRDCEDNRVRFLTLCRQAVRLKRQGTVQKAMGFLSDKCRRGLVVDTTTHEDDEWAQNFLRRTRRDPELARERLSVDLTERLCTAEPERNVL